MNWQKHLLSIAIALSCVVFILISFNHFLPKNKILSKAVIGKPTVTRGVYSNLTQDESTEVQLMSSLSSDNQITLFGSSEFGSSPYSSYYYLPDSLSTPTWAIGHAHHQCFSILCELLASKAYLKNSKICIILSPSWFHTSGTNTEAFAEFVRPNFLSRIWHDNSIKLVYKEAIGKFIFNHKNEFSKLSNEMISFMDLYLIANGNLINQSYSLLRQKLFEIHQSQLFDTIVQYKIKPNEAPLNKGVTILNQTHYLNKIQTKFIESIKNNTIYVEDNYYKTYLIDSNQQLRSDSIKEINLKNNNEFEDFNLLISFLREENCNASFVIQPLNPYYYNHVERNAVLIDSIENILTLNNFSYLNLYVNNKEDYQPGLLKDVMHLGDYGWMKINFFLDSLYNEK